MSLVTYEAKGSKRVMEKGKSTTFEHHQHCNFEDGEIKLKGKWHDGKTYIETYRPDGSLKHIKEYDRIITDFKTISKGKKEFLYTEKMEKPSRIHLLLNIILKMVILREGATKSGEYYGSYKSYLSETSVTIKYVKIILSGMRYGKIE